jgi:hypothetical protein
MQDILCDPQSLSLSSVLYIPLSASEYLSFLNSLCFSLSLILFLSITSSSFSFSPSIYVSFCPSISFHSILILFLSLSLSLTHSIHLPPLFIFISVFLSLSFPTSLSFSFPTFLSISFPSLLLYLSLFRFFSPSILSLSRSLPSLDVCLSFLFLRLSFIISPPAPPPHSLPMSGSHHQFSPYLI